MLISASAFGCSSRFNRFSDLGLIVTTSSINVFVDDVTVRMIDGTNLGGPMVTFGRPELNAQFGDTLVRAGTSRRFGFRSAFGCSRRGFVIGELTAFIVDTRGTRRRLTTSVALE